MPDSNSAAPSGAVSDLPNLDEATAAALRRRFADTGFTPALTGEADRFAPGVLAAPRLPLVRWWLARRPEPGAVLARLFTVADRLPEAEVRGALGDDLLAALIRAGVLVRQRGGDGGDGDGAIASPFLITPMTDDLWILSDPLTAGPAAVMGPGGGTLHLGKLVPRSLGGAVIDLGCGAGSLALLAARRGARRAVGVDVNPRAIEIARFNARLNAVAVELRIGDATQLPAAGDLFDLVLSQPPFVVHPTGQRNVTFLDGGPSGDELPQRFAAAAARLLAPGGRALMLLQSAEQKGRPLASRLRAALGGAACDLVVLATKAPPPSVQAAVFASYADPTFGDRYAEVARRYLDQFASLGLPEFAGALVVLGRPDDATGEARPHGPGSRGSAATVERTTLGLWLGHQDYDGRSLRQFLRGLTLVTAGPEALERARLRLAPTTRLFAEEPDSPQESAGASASASAGTSESERTVLRVQPPGIGTDWSLDAAGLRMLDAINEAPTLGAAIDAATGGARAWAGNPRVEWWTFARDALVRGALVVDRDAGGAGDAEEG